MSGDPDASMERLAAAAGGKWTVMETGKWSARGIGGASGLARDDKETGPLVGTRRLHKHAVNGTWTHKAVCVCGGNERGLSATNIVITVNAPGRMLHGVCIKRPVVSSRAFVRTGRSDEKIAARGLTSLGQTHAGADGRRRQ